MQELLVLPGAGVEVPEVTQFERGVNQPGLLEDGDRERPAHGGGVGVAPDEIEVDGGGLRFFRREADIGLCDGVEGLALFSGERAKVNRRRGGGGGGWREGGRERGGGRGGQGSGRECVERREGGGRGGGAGGEEQRGGDEQGGEEVAGHQGLL